MKKIVLSALAALTLGSVTANAGATKLYQDANGQVFTKPAEGRTEIKTPTSVFAKADKLKFSGQTFLGYTYTHPTDSTEANTQQFQIRRGYFQLKAYLLDDPKSYYRVTFDVKQKADTFDGQSVALRAKYAYLNLNAVLPATSLEIGLAHRPWHDYEEHNSWLYRSVSEVLVENHNSAHLSNSADLGVMAKTRTKFLDADIGLFNGEGYHALQNEGNGLSLEWRFTGHLLGTHGHPEKNTYFDASFYGQMNKKHYAVDGNTSKGFEDLEFYGFHTVYNMPAFLASAQYITSKNTAKLANDVSEGAGKGYTFNVEGRIGEDHQYKAFARYDKWTPEKPAGQTEYAKITEIIGIAWKMNKNVEWVANVTIDDNEYDAATQNDPKTTSYMLTTEINF